MDSSFVCLIWAIQQVFSILASEDLEDLIINEFAAANATGLTDEDGDHSDWIEIYNPGHQPVNLGGWSLTDDLDQLEKWLC